VAETSLTTPERLAALLEWLGGVLGTDDLHLLEAPRPASNGSSNETAMLRCAWTDPDGLTVERGLVARTAPRADGLFHGRRRVERGARRHDPGATGVETEIASRHGEGHFLQLAVEREVGPQQLLAAALDAGASTAEVQQDPIELYLGIDARPLDGERAGGRSVGDP